MPHKVSFLRLVNRNLDGFDADQMAAARNAILESSTLADALDRSHLLDDDPDREATLALLDALAPSVSAAIHATLVSAAERELPVVLQWKPGSDIEVTVWEAVDEGVGQVGVLLVTPYARTFVAQS